MRPAIPQKIDFSVVRNEGNNASEFNVRDRHNERKNENYYNGDVELERSHLNVHYQQHFRADGTPETYEETFKRLMAGGVISDKWHKPTSKSFDEMVFDVNTDYFERHGGYEYAKSFYAEAYRCAVNEIGGEEFILSAVLHADEKNEALSSKLGRDVYHYHLHVVYVPVVEKREYFRQKKGAPESERKLKAVYSQISHAKKWPGKVPVVRDGKTFIVNAYSLLQDRYYEHMRAAGFDGFERGVRGSTKENLSVTAYKLQQDMKRLESLNADIADKKNENTDLDKQAKDKRKQLAAMDKEIEIKEKAKSTVEEIEAMGKRNQFTGNTTFSADETHKLKTLAKKSVTADNKVRAANRRRDDAEKERDTAVTERDELKKRVDIEKPSVLGDMNIYQKLLKALQRAPRKLMAVIEEILKQPPEKTEPGYNKSKRMEVSR